MGNLSIKEWLDIFSQLFNFNLFGGAFLTAWLFLTQYEKIEKIFAVVTNSFRWMGVTVERWNVSFDIRSKINGFSKRVYDEIRVKEKPRIQVKFVTKTSPESFFRNNEIVVQMDCSENRSRNLCLATLLYVSKSLLKETRRYLSADMNEAIDLMVARRIFVEEASPEERDCFENIVLAPKCESSRSIDNLCEKISNVDRKGYFTRLFLRELYFLGPLLHGSWPTQEMRDEAERFLDYVELLAKTHLVEEPGRALQPREFYYRGRYIKARVILFANRETMQLWGIKPYLKRLKEGLNTGANVFYILSREESIDFVRQFCRDVHQRLVKGGILRKITDREYRIPEGRTKGKKHLCIIYRTKASLKGVDLDDLFKEIEEVAVEHPEGTEERREFQRLDTTLSARYRIKDARQLQEVTFHNCQVLNLSFGGARLDVPLQQGAIIEVVLKLPTTEQEIRGVGEVVWRDDTGSKVGIEFRKFNKDNRKYLERLSAYLDSELVPVTGQN